MSAHIKTRGVIIKSIMVLNSIKITKQEGKRVFSSPSPFYDRCREAVNGADEFDSRCFKNSVGSESNQDLWSSGHGVLIDIFVQRLLLYLDR